MPVLKDTQVDLFASSSALPEWRCAEWKCASGSSAAIGDYLPSVQYTLPPVIQLAASRLSYHLLSDEEGCGMTFGCVTALMARILSNGTDTMMVDLDRALSYITMAAQNAVLTGKRDTVLCISRQLRRILVRIGSLRSNVLEDSSFTTTNVHINYRIHAVLMLWMTAFRVFHLLEESVVDIELLYPMGDTSLAVQTASIIAYGLMTISTITGKAVMCQCATVTWHQLYDCLGYAAFWHMISELFRLSTQRLHFHLPSSRSSVMFLELCQAGGSIPPETFLDVLCALRLRCTNARLNTARAGGSCMECLREVVVSIDEHRISLERLHGYLKQMQVDELTGSECLLQHFFNALTARGSPPTQIDDETSRGSGEAWLSAVKEHCDGTAPRQDADAWSAFVRLTCLLCSRNVSVWHSVKSRFFSKLSPKRLREMPLSSLVDMLTLFLSLSYSTGLQEVADKTLSLITAMFDASDSERQEILLRAVHCIILVHRQRALSDCRAVTALSSMIEKLDERDASGIFTDSYLYLVPTNSCEMALRRFLPHMTAIDMDRVLEASASSPLIPECLWNYAIDRLATPNSASSMAFVITQLKARCAGNLAFVSQGIRTVVTVLLSESWSTQVALQFLIELCQQFELCTRLPIDHLLPLWLAVAMTHLENDDLTRISQFVHTGFGRLMEEKGFTTTDCDSGEPSTTAVARSVFQSLNDAAIENGQWAREMALRWLEPVVVALHKVLPTASSELCMHSSRICAYIYRYASLLIYRPPSQCKFNQSLFVRLSKLYIQGMLLVRELDACFVDEALPDYMIGLATLPIESSSYLQRIIIDIVQRFSRDRSLSNTMKHILSAQPRVVSVLYSVCKANTDALNFFTGITH